MKRREFLSLSQRKANGDLIPRSNTSLYPNERAENRIRRRKKSLFFFFVQFRGPITQFLIAGKKRKKRKRRSLVFVNSALFVGFFPGILLRDVNPLPENFVFRSSLFRG